MQNSELYRRGAVVPLMTDGLLAIRHSEVSESTQVVAARLDREADFEWLWEQNFFGRIGRLTGATLDDYEEDEIGADQADHVLKIVKQFQRRGGMPPAIHAFLADLAMVCATAKRFDMPIFFIL